MDMKPLEVGLVVVLSGFGISTCESPVSPGGSRTESVVVPSSSALASSPLTAARLSEDFPFKRILCFGESITFGLTLQAGSSSGGRSVLTLVEGYVPKLARLLTEKHGEGFELFNGGISGENTELALDRIDTAIRRHNPDLILLLEGVLDVNNESPRFGAAESNLAEMMRITQLRQVAIIAGTYPLPNPEGFRTRGAGNIRRLNKIIREEALAKGVPIADHEEAFPRDFSGQGPDGLHPNEIGYRIMAQTWFDTIEAMVGSGT